MLGYQYTPLGPASVHKALGNSLRLYLFEYLCHQELTIEDFVQITGEKYNNLHTQLKILEQVNLVESYIDGKYRYYVAAEQSLTVLHNWMDLMSDILREREL